MKAIVKLVIAALVVHACWKSSIVVWRFYKLKDGAQNAALFAGTRSEAEIQDRVIEIAHELDVPIDPDKLSVRKVPSHTYIKGVYVDKIEIVPGYFYPWAFTLDLDVLTLGNP
jgi:hypothetical protein